MSNGSNCDRRNDNRSPTASSFRPVESPCSLEFGLFATLILCVTVYFVLCLDLNKEDYCHAIMDRDSHLVLASHGKVHMERPNSRAGSPRTYYLHHSFPLQQSEPNWESALNVIGESIFFFENPCFR